MEGSYVNVMDTEETNNSSNNNNNNNNESVVVDVVETKDNKENIEILTTEETTSLEVPASPSRPEVTEIVKRITKKMNRNQLEELITEKVLECMGSKAEVGRMRARVGTLVGQRDKINMRCQALLTQVQDLNRAIKNLSEQYARNPKDISRCFTPIKFYRSVGLSCNLLTPVDGSTITRPLGAAKSAPLRPCPNSVKIAQLQQLQNIPSPGKLVIQQQQQAPMETNVQYQTMNGNGMKRYKQPMVSVTEVRNKMPRMIGVGSPGGAGNNNMNNPNNTNRNTNTVRQVRPVRPLINAVPKANPIGNNVIPTVDLTDDTPVVTTQPKQQQIILNQNGIRYQVINPAGVGTSNVTVVSSANGGNFLVASTPQGPRPLVFQQASPARMRAVNRQPQQQQQQIVYRAARQVQQQPQQQQERMIVGQNRTLTIGQQLGIGVGPNRQQSVVLQKNDNVLTSSKGNNGSPTQKISNSNNYVLPTLPAVLLGPEQVSTTKSVPPRPKLTLTHQPAGIVLSWTHETGVFYAEIANYQIFSCQEPNEALSGIGGIWRRVGNVKALPLPMACTLSQFTEAARYHFIVRGVDCHGRSGSFCEPAPIDLRHLAKE